MSDIKEGFFPYKEFRYDKDQDAYELMSRWTSADTVYLQDGTTNVSTKLESLDETIGGIINDTTTSLNATWSSTKLSNELDTLNDLVSEKAKIQYQRLAPHGSMEPGEDFTWIVDMFEGFFSMSRNSKCVCGIIDRWEEAVTYITDRDDTFATVGFFTEEGRKKVVFQNNSDVNILVMYVADGKTFS